MLGVRYIEGQIPLELPDKTIVQAYFKFSNNGDVEIEFSSLETSSILMERMIKSDLIGLGLFYIEQAEMGDVDVRR